MKNVKNIIYEENGSALAMVMIAMVVVFLLVAGLVNVSVRENTHALYQSDEVTAYYIARAGAESMAKELKRMDKSLLSEFEGTGKTATAQGSILATTGTVGVHVQRQGTSDDFLITATGNYDGHTEVAKIMMAYNEVHDIDFAAYSKEDMTKDSGGNINFDTVLGDLASGGTVQIHTNKLGDVGEVLNYEDLDIYILQMDISSINLSTDLVPVDLSGGGITISHSSFIQNMSFGNSDILNVDTSNAEFERIEDYTKFEMIKNSVASDKWMILYFDGSNKTTGEIIVTGNNNLMIIVDGDFEISGNHSEFTTPGSIYTKWYIIDDGNDGDDLIFNHGNAGVVDQPEKLEVIIYGDDSIFKLNNNGTLYGKIYADGGKVIMKNGNTVLYGSIYAEEVILDAQVQIIYKESSSEIDTVGRSMDIDHWEE